MMQCRIDQRWDRNELELTLYQTDAQGRPVAFVDPVKLTMTLRAPESVNAITATPPPSFVFMDGLGVDFLRAIVDAAAELGIVAKDNMDRARRVELLEAERNALFENLADLRAVLGINRPGSPKIETVVRIGKEPVGIEPVERRIELPPAGADGSPPPGGGGFVPSTPILFKGVDLVSGGGGGAGGVWFGGTGGRGVAG